MKEYTGVTMTVKLRYYKDSKSSQYGKRSLSAYIEYDNSTVEKADKTDVVASAGALPSVSDKVAEVQTQARKVTYKNYTQNIDVATFISNAIQFVIQDAIEQEIRPLKLHVELADDVVIPPQVIGYLSSWYATDPLFHAITFNRMSDEQDY